MFGLNGRLYTFLTDVILNDPVWENVETVNTKLKPTSELSGVSYAC